MSVFVVVLVLLGMLPGIVLSAEPGRQESNDQPPDIVLVLADDMAEADWRSLPKTTRLLPAVFPNYINVDPLCCPSRASILRGQYPHTHGTVVNQGEHGGWKSFVDEEDSTIAVALQAVGYQTGLFGKYLNGYTADSGIPPGWDVWFAMINEGYFDWKAVDGTEVRTFGARRWQYSTDVIARKAIRFVEKAPVDRPLFAYVTPYAPHHPATVAPRYRGDCRNEPLGTQQKPSFNERRMSDKPRYMRNEKLEVSRLVEEDRKRQCSLKSVDDLVVGLVAALDARGRPYNLIFASDNGYLMGEHRRTEKAVPYEESIRTTMRAVGPDFPTGTDDRLIGNIDLAATFADIAGAEPRTDWDGRSILDPEGVGRELIGIEGFGPGRAASEENEFTAAGGFGRDQKKPAYHGFRTRDGIVYIEYATEEVELYHLRDDPYQLKNLAKGKSASDYPAYSARVDALRECHADACRAAEDTALEVGGGFR